MSSEKTRTYEVYQRIFKDKQKARGTPLNEMMNIKFNKLYILKVQEIGCLLLANRTYRSSPGWV